MFKKSDWVGRKFKCLETGTEVVLTEDIVYPRAFIGIGKGAIDLGDGYYSRSVGSIVEIKEKKMTCKAVVAVYLKTASGDWHLFLYDDVDGPDEFSELVSRDMGTELAYVCDWEAKVLYGDLDTYEEALRVAILEADA